MHDARRVAQRPQGAKIVLQALAAVDLKHEVQAVRPERVPDRPERALGVRGVVDHIEGRDDVELAR